MALDFGHFYISVVLIWGEFARLPQGPVAVSGEILVVSFGGCCWSPEGRGHDPATHSAMHRTAPLHTRHDRVWRQRPCQRACFVPRDNTAGKERCSECRTSKGLEKGLSPIRTVNFRQIVLPICLR